jgi:hypothetical protein
MNKIDISDFLSECADDYVGLWSLIRLIKHQCPGCSSDQVVTKSLGIIIELLDQGRIKIGQFNQNKEYQSWRLTAKESAERVETEWKKLGRDPDIGEIAWFTIDD